MKKANLNKAFGRALAKLRKNKSWSQEFLSFEAHVTRSYISLLERGEKSPTLNTISLLATALRVGEAELIRLTLEELSEDPRQD